MPIDYCKIANDFNLLNAYSGGKIAFGSKSPGYAAGPELVWYSSFDPMSSEPSMKSQLCLITPIGTCLDSINLASSGSTCWPRCSWVEGCTLPSLAICRSWRGTSNPWKSCLAGCNDPCAIGYSNVMRCSASKPEASWSRTSDSCFMLAMRPDPDRALASCMGINCCLVSWRLLIDPEIGRNGQELTWPKLSWVPIWIWPCQGSSRISNEGP